MMELKYTNRGFGCANFVDRNGVECSIQESSSAEYACIWLGCNEIGLKKFVPNQGGWQDVELEHNPPCGVLHSANTRMHLNQDQVRALLPLLQHFAETGELPTPNPDAD